MDYEFILVFLLLVKYVDNIFFLNVREFLKIFVVLFMGSMEVERLFFCIWRIYIWFCNIMIIECFLDLVVIVMYVNVVIIDRSVVCEKFVVLYFR